MQDDLPSALRLCNQTLALFSEQSVSTPESESVTGALAGVKCLSSVLFKLHNLVGCIRSASVHAAAVVDCLLLIFFFFCCLFLKILSSCSVPPLGVARNP